MEFVGIKRWLALILPFAIISIGDGAVILLLEAVQFFYVPFWMIGVWDGVTIFATTLIHILLKRSINPVTGEPTKEKRYGVLLFLLLLIFTLASVVLALLATAQQMYWPWALVLLRLALFPWAKQIWIGQKP